MPSTPQAQPQQERREGRLSAIEQTALESPKHNLQGTLPSVTIGLSTFNRAHLWRQGFLVESLLNQTDTDFELLICDDGSTDETPEILKALLTPAMKARAYNGNANRVFHCAAPKANGNQSSGLPDNVLYQNARGDVFLHMDDDCFLHPGAVAYVKKFFADRGANAPRGGVCLWSCMRFVDPEDLTKLLKSSKAIDQRLQLLPLDQTITRLHPRDQAEWGPVFAVNTHVLRYIGGNGMRLAAMRGCDHRLGARLRECVPTYFCAAPEFTANHVGLTWMRKKIEEGKHEEVVRGQVSPYHRNYNVEVVENGGGQFWKSGALEKLYQEVTP